MGEERDASFTRREALATIALGSAALVTGCAGTTTASSVPVKPILTAGVQKMPIPPALAGNHTVVPLPFVAASLNGLSERMITSHHENNYGGAVRNLNRVEQELAQITAETPPLMVAALRERELTFRNSKALHEAYFANLGGNGKRSGAIENALAQAYGTTAKWEQHTRATGMGLGGGSGWVILAFELDTGALRTVSSMNHTQALAVGSPLLVLDMYEHSYQMDFGAGVAKYIDAFFANVNWDEVNRRLERAERMSAIWRGTTG
ncbi:MAG TPA: Fe-Mn family superoxide dismutase [Polyangium sp.]|nr:Fe-Mn family superoxide dismutase [Polyangium sp.]